MAAFSLALTFLRLVLGPVAIVVACKAYDRQLFVPILIAGMLSDYFDGVLARRFNVAFPWLRRFDSMTDAVFYLCILISAWIVARSTILAAIVPLAVLVSGEVACYGLSFFKFRVFPAIHALSAKFYGLCLFIACLCVISYGTGPWILWALAGVSVIANAEVAAILLLSKEAPVDVLSIFHCRRKPARAVTENGQDQCR
jgi:CDP-diacylglycerol---glycerol-3-phosphate 3-phosphatidyltransferase